MKRYVVSLLILNTLISFHVCCQDLPRRAFFGIQMEPVTDDVQRVMNLPAAKGVLVQRVIPGSTAEKAGIQTGDVLLTIDGKEVNTPDEAVRLVGSYRAGQSFTYTYHRNDRAATAQTTVQGYAKEAYHDLTVEYGSVQTSNATLRTIVTKPTKATGKLPAMLFIQGIGCYSIDTPLDTTRSETQLINAIARNGYVVMRVDKSGIGDSKGPPCNEIDFNTELDGYSGAFEALQARQDVDAGNSFIFGHSMGGVMAPKVAALHAVKGIIVYGTLGVNFMEYLTLSRRNIAEAYQMNPAEADIYIKEQCACAAMMINAHVTRDEAVRRIPACGEVYDFLLDRTEDFWYQLNDLNIPGLWQQYKGSLLSMRGDLDYITTRHEHEYIASVVNTTNPGKGTFMEMKNCTHAMETALNYDEAIRNPGPFDTNISSAVINWLNQQTGSVKRQVMDHEKVTEVLWADGVENAYPRISRDGQRILFQSNRSGKWHLYLMNSDGSNVQQLTSGDHNNNFPDWSVDEQSVAFVSDRTGNEEIFIMKVDGNMVKQLTQHPARDIHPYFSPDGKEILFNSSRDDAQSFEVYRINSDGSGERRVTTTRDVETCARYSPDGSKIVLLKGFLDGNDEICVMDPDGTDVINLTNTSAMEGWPTWSRNGTHILYSSRKNGQFCLFEMEHDGENVTQVSFPEPGFEDARATYASATGAIAFNRQRSGTIGIYLLQPDKG